MCALAFGSCRSHKTVSKATATNTPSRPEAVWRPSHPPVTPKAADSNDPAIVARLIDSAYEWLGTPYRYGGTDRSGADCSGFMQRLFADVADVALPRNSARQAESCHPIDRERLEPGDLVFFNGSRIGADIGHVGLYLGEERMIHASSSKGVTVSAITSQYYAARYCGAGRVPAIMRGKHGAAPVHHKETPRPQPAPSRELPERVLIPAPAEPAPQPEAEIPDTVISAWMD